MASGDKHLDLLIKNSKIKANKIKTDQFSSMDDFELSLRLWFSRKYNMPMFHPILDNYDIEKMLLEIQLHKEDTISGKEVAEMLKDQKEEIDDMFKDFDEQLAPEEQEFMKNIDWEDTGKC